MYTSLFTIPQCIFSEQRSDTTNFSELVVGERSLKTVAVGVSVLNDRFTMVARRLARLSGRNKV